MLVDTHAHLTDDKFTNISSIIEKSRNNLVNNIIVPTTSLEDLDKALDLAKKYDGIYVLAGVHPENIEEVNSITDLINELKKRIKRNKKIIGIGEIGLDFYYDKEKKTLQKQVALLKAQMELAAELGLPVAIHMRDAEVEMAELLEGMKKLPRGQFHCFSGSKDFLELILHWNFYVSFAGNITYKSAENLRSRLSEVPLNRLLLETDSPYLTPEPIRGTLNEPVNVKIIAKFIADQLGLTAAKINEITQKNTTCLYSLGT